MLARACWYWSMPVLNMVVAPLAFSSAGLFGKGGMTVCGIPCPTRPDVGLAREMTQKGRKQKKIKKIKKEEGRGKKRREEKKRRIIVKGNPSQGSYLSQTSKSKQQLYKSTPQAKSKYGYCFGAVYTQLSFLNTTCKPNGRILRIYYHTVQLTQSNRISKHCST